MSHHHTNTHTHTIPTGTAASLPPTQGRFRFASENPFEDNTEEETDSKKDSQGRSWIRQRHVCGSIDLCMFWSFRDAQDFGFVPRPIVSSTTKDSNVLEESSSDDITSRLGQLLNEGKKIDPNDPRNLSLLRFLEGLKIGENDFKTLQMGA